MESDQNLNKPTQEQIDEWKRQHGKVLLVCVDDDEYYFKYPNRQSYKRYLDTIASGKLYDGLMVLIVDCCLHPSASEINGRINENFQLPALLSGEIQKAVGGDATVFSKNL